MMWLGGAEISKKSEAYLSQNKNLETGFNLGPHELDIA